MGVMTRTASIITSTMSSSGLMDFFILHLQFFIFFGILFPQSPAFYLQETHLSIMTIISCLISIGPRVDIDNTLVGVFVTTGITVGKAVVFAVLDIQKEIIGEKGFFQFEIVFNIV